MAIPSHSPACKADRQPEPVWFYPHHAFTRRHHGITAGSRWQLSGKFACPMCRLLHTDQPEAVYLQTPRDAIGRYAWWVTVHASLTTTRRGFETQISLLAEPRRCFNKHIRDIRRHLSKYESTRCRSAVLRA